METTEQDRRELLAEAGLSIECTFVPFSKSRHCVDPSVSWFKNPNTPTLNWKIMIKVNDRPVMTTDYSQGYGHIPGIKLAIPSAYETGIIAETLETGRVPRHQAPHVAKIGKVPEPSLDDVMFSLLMDGEADFDAMTFDDWASNYGYDSDSREAERIYNQCRETGTKLRAALGIEIINKLRDAYQDC